MQQTVLAMQRGLDLDAQEKFKSQVQKEAN
jgi:hypothetical protein